MSASLASAMPSRQRRRGQTAAGVAPQPQPQQQQVAPQREAPAQAAKPARGRNNRSENYYDIKTTIFNALIDAIDLTQLASSTVIRRAKRSATSSTRSSR
jgi:pilus assembly protein CpaF